MAAADMMELQAPGAAMQPDVLPAGTAVQPDMVLPCRLCREMGRGGQRTGINSVFVLK